MKDELRAFEKEKEKILNALREKQQHELLTFDKSDSNQKFEVHSVHSTGHSSQPQFASLPISHSTPTSIHSLTTSSS